MSARLKVLPLQTSNRRVLLTPDSVALIVLQMDTFSTMTSCREKRSVLSVMVISDVPEWTASNSSRKDDASSAALASATERV
jgi:hypothetical protein